MATYFSNSRQFSVGSVSVNNFEYNTRKSPLDNLYEYAVVDAFHNAAVRSSAPRCWPETRKEVQRDIFRWIEKGTGGGKGRPGQMLWVRGPAGAGKSAIAGSLAEQCQREGLLAASFFFSALAGSSSCRTRKRLIPTLAYQLVINDDVGDLKKAILWEIANDPSIFHQRVEDQLEALILRPLRTICRQLLTKVILIDGFDECEAVAVDQLSNKAACSPAEKELAQKEVLSALLKLKIDVDHDPTFPFRIIIFSRPEAVIQDFFSRNTTNTEQIHLEDERYDADGDITRFVRGKLAEIRGRLRLKTNWPSEQDKVIKTIVRNASGQFIYAAVAMNYLAERGNGEHPQTKLNRILGADEIAKHDSESRGRPFEQLDALYRCILYTSPIPRDAVKWIHAILELHSEGSDSLAIVKAFLESKPGEMEHLLGNLSSLLSITDTFRIFHKSLLDYLGSERCKLECADLYVDSTTTTTFLQERWYNVLKNKGPQVELDAEECTRFLQHYVDSLTMRYFLPSSEKEGYNPADIDWWSDVCSEQFRPCDNRVERVLQIVHETCHWLRCRPHCKIWRTRLRRVRLGYSGWVLPNAFYFVTLLLYPLQGYT